MTFSSNTDRLQDLGLRGFVAALERQQASPPSIEMCFDDRLSALIDAEVAEREARRFKRYLDAAKFKVTAYPEHIRFSPDRNLDRAMTADILTCGWISKNLNGIITGATGTGKTWLACAFGVEAARQGLPVLYHRASLLLETLAAAHLDGSIRRERARLAKARLLIIDDFGLAKLNSRGVQDLLEILDSRVGRASTIIAGQMPFESWHDFIGDPAMADAILDRVAHSSFRICLTGESLRRMKS